MWGLARSLSGRALAESVRLDAHFKAPLPLAARVLQSHRRQGAVEQWALQTASDTAPLLLAQLDEAPREPMR
ncbi:MAG: hypothetical protein GAK45_00968 [Pseudomonas citronellolis]|nr:MAG: hypothetical protein GAK45_00968 [Pseudomonas citronellolis]